MLANDAVADREPEPGALPDFARREERIEDASQILFLEAAAVVGHLDQRCDPARRASRWSR